MSAHTRRQFLTAKRPPPPKRPSPPRPLPGADEDAETLESLAAVELLSIAVAEAILDGGHLGPRGRRLARRVLSAERAHLGLLAARLRGLGSRRLPRLARTPAALDLALGARHVSRRLEDVHSEHDALDLLLDLEGMAEGAYYAALSKLRAPELVELCARLLASEGQHEAVLGALREPKDLYRAAPYAFVEGIKP